MAAVAERTKTGAPRAVRGVRIGVLRSRRPPAEPKIWPGDLNAGVWYPAASLPRWINHGVRERLIRRLAFAEACVLVLAVSHGLMVLIHH